MSDYAKDADRNVLNARQALRANDPEQTLTETELDQVLWHFRNAENASDPDLRRSIGWQFQSFMVSAMKERFIKSDGKLKQVSKPSTRIGRDIKQLSKAGDALYAKFAKLDAVTKTWLGQYLNESDQSSKGNARAKLREIDDRIYYLAQDLALAVRAVEGLASHGPNNMAIRIMVEQLAYCWEKAHGEPPTSDNGRRRRHSAFLAVCQEMAGIADARLKEKGGRLGTLNLEGIVGEVLKEQLAKPI